MSEPLVFMVTAEDLYDKIFEAHIQTGHEGNRMIIFSEEKCPRLSVGDTTILSVPTADRGPLDFNNIFGVITQFKNGVYRLGAKEGLIKGWFPRMKIAKSGKNAILLNDLPSGTFLISF